MFCCPLSDDTDEDLEVSSLSRNDSGRRLAVLQESLDQMPVQGLQVSVEQIQGGKGSPNEKEQGAQVRFSI